MNVELVGDNLRISWGDGLSLWYDPTELRRRCPCATCNEARLRAGLQRHEPLPKTGEVTIQSMSAAGNYGYQIGFSDGHDTGIYDLELLRGLGRVKL